MTSKPMHTASKEMALHTLAMFNPLHTLQIKNCSKSNSAIKIATMKDRKGNHHVLLPNQHLLLSAKINGMQRRTLVCP